MWVQLEKLYTWECGAYRKTRGGQGKHILA